MHSPTFQYRHRSNPKFYRCTRLVAVRKGVQKKVLQRNRCEPGHVCNQIWYSMARVNVDTARAQTLAHYDTCQNGTRAQ